MKVVSQQVAAVIEWGKCVGMYAGNPNRWPTPRVCLLWMLFWCCWSENLLAQSYGLRFVSHEDIQDKRTSLNLSPDQPLCLNGTAELSFDFRLLPNHRSYFGYVFRLIQDEKQNLDLLFEPRSKSLKVIINGRFCQSVIRLDSALMYSSWNHLIFHLDLTHQRLQAHANNKLVIQDALPFDESGCFRLFFGSNDFKAFRSKDLPPMAIKDVAIAQNGEPLYHWPLDESQGTAAHEAINGMGATVKNPVWLQSLHSVWEVTDRFVMHGNASATFDPTTETLYVVGAEALRTYAVRSQKVSVTPYAESLGMLWPGNQSIYDPFTHQLYAFFVDQKAVAQYNPLLNSWKTTIQWPRSVFITEYWHANKFIHKTDSTLYVLGGYGQLTYKSRISRYHFATQTWDSLPARSHVYMPRYLAALGTTPSTDTAYVIGGYGSLTGEQMLNPKSTYDLLLYQVKTNTFQKLFELEAPQTDFAFANSLVIDTKNKAYYGLIFPNQQFKSNLQLIRGSLTKPMYELLGQLIPYPFHDTHSFADLYYCHSSQKLVAITLYRNDDKGTTEGTIYTISFPPNAIAPPAPAETNTPVWVWTAIGAGGVLLSGTWLYLRQRRRKKEIVLAAQPFAKEPVGAETPAVVVETAVAASPEPVGPRKASIYFFGNFQVIDAEGHDITKAFTPLIKELFLLLALNSLGKQQGIPSEKLSELLWPDKAGRDASNNRSVNIAKLKSILDKVGASSVSKQSGYWTIAFDAGQMQVDYLRYITLVNSRKPLAREAITELEEITKRGPFLLNTEYAWLDDFKADVSNEIVNTFQQYLRICNLSEDPEFAHQVANGIFHYDPVNEEAIMMKCKALVLLGKHTLAKNAFEKFVRDYKDIYGEEYEQSFPAIIE